MSTIRRIAGIDSCPAGWVVASATLRGHALGARSTRIVTRLDALFEAPRPLDLAAIDIPIGLPDVPLEGGRTVDRAARAALGKKAPSVFSAPARCLLACPSYASARAESRRASRGRISLSAQAFNLIPKVRQIDELVRHIGQDRLVECHPELAFATEFGKPVRQTKKTPEGFAKRVAILREAGVELAPDALGLVKAASCARDDIVDAHACLLVARRISLGVAQRLPQAPETDSFGLRMEMWA